MNINSCQIELFGFLYMYNMKDQMTITEYKIIDDITKVLKQTCETDHPYLVMLV